MGILEQRALSLLLNTFQLAQPTALLHRTCFISSLHPAWAGDQLPKWSKHLPNSRKQSPEVLAGPEGMSEKASEELKTSQSLKPPWNLPKSDSVLGAELTDASYVQFSASKSLLLCRAGRSQQIGEHKGKRRWLCWGWGGFISQPRVLTTHRCVSSCFLHHLAPSLCTHLGAFSNYKTKAISF